MLEGLWTVEFKAAMGAGTGVIVVNPKTIMGGDAGYYYAGTYKVENGAVHAELDVVRFSQHAVSIFGSSERHSVVLDGPVNEKQMQLSGYLKSNPSQKFSVICKKERDA